MLKVLQMVVGIAKCWPTHLCLDWREKVTLDFEMLSRVTTMTDLARPTILRSRWIRRPPLKFLSAFSPAMLLPFWKKKTPGITNRMDVPEVSLQGFAPDDALNVDDKALDAPDSPIFANVQLRAATAMINAFPMSPSS